MYLEHQETLTPEELAGEVSNLGIAQPLVFLNACQIGRGAMSLTDIGGWASQFVRAGAGAFAGAFWYVYDKPAYDFAQAFYGRLLAGVPIGRAAQGAVSRSSRRATLPGWPTLCLLTHWRPCRYVSPIPLQDIGAYAINYLTPLRILSEAYGHALIPEHTGVICPTVARPWARQMSHCCATARTRCRPCSFPRIGA